MADAMRQVLDIVEGLEQSESAEGGARQIVWRLTDARTNSPPFTIVAEPFPIHPSISVALEANRIALGFTGVMRSLLSGDAPEQVEREIVKPLRRTLERNLNGIGKTDITLAGEAVVSIVPQNARVAVLALDRLDLEEEASHRDWSRTEYGTVESEVSGLTRWNDKPALVLVERLSGEKFTGVLSDTAAEKIGGEHTWREAWEGRRVFVSGALHYNSESVIKRADIEDLVSVGWTDVSLSDMRKIDILEGRTVADHLATLRGDNRG